MYKITFKKSAKNKFKNSRHQLSPELYLLLKGYQRTQNLQARRNYKEVKRIFGEYEWVIIE